MERNHNKALIIVDAQRGFMPQEEGDRLGIAGFGELPVPDGQNVVPTLNELTKVFTAHELTIATTQDMHKPGTAHISETPDFVDTWPTHCLEGTPGAELHPDLLAADSTATHFIKGDVVAATPAEDDSYTGALAHNDDSGERILLPDFLRARGATKLYIGGLALGDGKEHPLCVDSTAIDLAKAGFEVTVITDAVEAVVPENREVCFRNLGVLGIRLLDHHEVATEVFNTPEVIR